MKNIINTLCEEFKQSKWKTIIIGLMIIVVFNDWFEFITDNILIPKVFFYLKSAWYVDLIIGLFILILIPFKNLKKQTASTTSVLAITSFLFLIIYYRYFTDRWDYYSFSFLSKIKYIDTLWVLYLFQLFFWSRNFKPINETLIKEPAFMEDLPVENPTKDTYHFKEYALEIAEKLNIGSYKKSFAIGINGSWGSGKTSLLNLITLNLSKNDSNIIVKFNPWACQNNDILIREFFNQISSSIKLHNRSIGKLLIQYSKKLISASDTKLSGVIMDVINEFSKDDSIKELYNEIDNHIKKLNKKIIITIDDIDRLNFEEINEVLKLVRNTANFSNTVFILLYDKNYINKAVEKLNTSNSSLYVEKIVQLEINLPSNERNTIKTELIKGLDNSFPNLDLMFLKELHQSHNWSGDYISPWIKNLRDVNRLINGIRLNYNKLIDEVVFEDFLKIEILRLKLPNLYESVKTESNRYLKVSETAYQKNGFKLLYENDNKDAVPLISKKAKELYPNHDIQDITNLFNCIFIDKHDNKFHHRLSIVYPSNFIRYFRYLVSSNEISEIKFANARKNGLVEMKKNIDVWVENDKFLELRQVFKDIEFYDSEEDYKVIIDSILYYSNKIHNDGFSRHIVGYDYYDFKSKLNLNKKTINEKEKTLFYELMQNQDNIGSFELSFLNMILSESSHDVNIPREEIMDLYVTNVNNLIDKVVDFKNDFRDCYHMKFIKGWDDKVTYKQSKDEVIPEIHEKLKSKYLSFPVDIIIESLVQYNIRSDDNLMKKINSAYVNEFFGGYEGLSIYLEGHKDNPSNYLLEFQDFYSQNEKVNFEKFIEYTFNNIPEKH